MAVAVANTVQALPAMAFLRAVHDQIPAAALYTVTLVNISFEIMTFDTQSTCPATEGAMC